ncbi:MAG TPA: hypothetical protein VKR52_15925 [Terracidiphilus sp.]|nr:hypothetical protein [Terracidiphilus sp.]
MPKRSLSIRIAQVLLCLIPILYMPGARAASCTTQAQMTGPQRDALSSAARTMLVQMQSGDMLNLKANTLPAVAGDFAGIASSIQSFSPTLRNATITVDELYLLDNSAGTPAASRVDFFCGTPVVVVNFSALPQGTYALAILHATGVPEPQQVSLILAQSAPDRWMFAGYFRKPMTEAGHDGLWYWVSARKYAQTKMDWAAWLYYKIAIDLLNPLDFLSSPNMEKLRKEADGARPPAFPGTQPMMLNASGSSFRLTAVDISTAFGGLDLDVHYAPDPAQTAQLRNPMTARQQVTTVMTALVDTHPELRSAFHGIWVHADEGNASLFALELPMTGISAGAPQRP